jgi:hypothetical protein
MLRLGMIVVALLFSTTGCAQPQSLPLDKIKLPKGFAIEIVARVENARGMALGDKGTLFAGSTRAGKVYAIRITPGSPAQVFTVASGLQRAAHATPPRRA